jgi:hypothetical protein
MAPSIRRDHLVDELLPVLDEVFQTHHGIFLDPGTSMLDALRGRQAAQASQPVGGRCARLAAQVAHVSFDLEVLEAYITSRKSQEVDWGDVWRRVSGVAPEAWHQLGDELDMTYRRVAGRLRAIQEWDDSDLIGGAIAIAVHSAYHRGEMCQAICVLQT